MRTAPLPDIESAESTFREVNGVTLHIVAAGDRDDPLVVLLHGFPEFWYEWRDYVGPLVDAGYRVLVPDQRGYNRSDKPDGIRAYRIGNLSGDIDTLIESAGRESAHVVGHDWGAAIAWDLALRHPDAIDRLSIMNVPHPTVFEETLKSSPRQLRKSWYMLFFQVPRVPEWVHRRNDFQRMVDAMGTAEEGTFTDEDFECYRQAWSQEGALTAMIHWYRALFRGGEEPRRERVEAPTLVLWGEGDQFLLPEMAPESLEYCEDGRLERFPDASHWVPHERREQVTDLLVEHFRGNCP